MTKGISRGVGITVAVGITIVLAACSSSNDSAGGSTTGAASSATDWAAGKCAQIGSKSCPNDAPTTQSSRDECESKRTDAKCGALYVTYLQCVGGHVTCTGEGKLDISKFIGPCVNEFARHDLCITPINFDGGVLDAASNG